MARKTAEEAEITRQRLLTAGLKVFAERGCSGASLEMIAAQAGVTRGAVYWHFKGRHRFLQGVLEQSVLPLEHFAQPGVDLETALSHLEAALQATFTEPASRQLCEILLNNREPLGHACLISMRLQIAQERFTQQLEVILSDAVMEGELAANLDVPAAGHLFKVFLMGLLFECTRQPLKLALHIAATLELMRVALHRPL